MPDGTSITIEGEFHEVEPPDKLVYTWRMGQEMEEVSLVTVRFEGRGDSTEVIVIHDQIPSDRVRDSHEAGWNGCLDGLSLYVAATEDRSA
jgi:uncharacterized protein YndB with AHSA1/START domain